MGRVLHVRLDEATEQALNRLSRESGPAESDLVRRALAAYADGLPASTRPAIIGLGEFSSGVGDLASNKAHLAGLGSKSTRKP